MITLASLEACTGCSACKAVCPKGAISMTPDSEGFLRPSIDATLCVQCHACERVCPVLHPGTKDESPTCYAAKSMDDTVRMASSSGGIFSVLAKAIFARGGVVFGCVWEMPSLVAIHAKAENEEELAAMRGSKYVQSDLRETFREAKASLEAGRAVLFSGTPCQIAGLNRFLGKAYATLFMVEIICHGVPSPAVFEKCKADVEALHHHRLTSFAFRKKSPSWRQGKVCYTFDHGEVIDGKCYLDDTYVKAFLKDLSLRPSCYQCVAREGRSGADITLGDFWGIEKVCPQLDDDRGTSAVLVHTAKGRVLWNEIVASLEVQPVTVAEVVAGNPAYYRPVGKPKGRERFMRLFRKRDMGKLALRCSRGPWVLWMARRCLGKVKRWIKKVLGR